ncbi:uncharacterized protein LOC131665945 [Phymastichus coffea]|uniref:uncharacterized protein LOC131665945 n=1 Tax=Phymastichus coffea TaxID=108790 RepID=UPI00273AA0BD|nr:uncharacterized protein LOC131665945 [Phymastichus coffea]
MAKKSKKRQLEADVNVDEKIGTDNSVDTGSSKKKLKVIPEKSGKKNKSSFLKQNDFKIKDIPEKHKLENETIKLDVKASNNVVDKKLKKKNKKKAKEQEKLEMSADNETAPLISNDKESTKLKRKELLQKKRAEFKAKQKQLGHRAGLSATLSKLSLADMKKRIADIQSRETISKTAIRRLRILKKKVQVLESGGSSETSTEKDGTSKDILKEDKKNQIKKKTNIKAKDDEVDPNKSNDKKNKKITDIKNKKKQKFVAKNLNENLFIEDRIGDSAHDSSNDSSEEENGLNIKKVTKNIKKIKKIMSSNSNIEKVNKNESNSDEDDDENIDTDDDESKNDSREETNESDNQESSDESDDDNESENTNEIVKTDISVTKTKKVQKKKSNQDANKLKSNSSETDSKQKRYVLFVGNIAYNATTVDLKKHFLTKVEKVKDVRIPLDSSTNKPRGFAYVEVENSKDYEKALSLHHTFINGRQIKVEYTASGSKKASRNPEVIHKNKKLHALRKDGKLVGSKKFSNKRSFRRNFKNNPNKGFGKSKQKAF